MKRIIRFLLLSAAALLLTGCQADSGKEAAASADPGSIPPVREEHSYPAGYVATDAYGGEYMTPEGMKKSDEQQKKYEEITKKLEAYLAAHPDGKLYAHFAGVWQADGWDDVTIRLDDIEDKEVLKELEEVGIESDYRLERWAGSKEAGENAEKQLKEALAALQAKVLRNKEEKLLLTKYHPKIEGYAWFLGMIFVELECDTPWYEGVTTEEMEKDRELAISLFRKYIGDYEFVTFIFPV